jgi:hypothetical protein
VSGPKGLFSWVESEYILIILWMAGAIGSIR